MKRQPRPYQQDALEAIRKNHTQGINKQLIVMATGTGKTVVFVHLIVDLIKKTGKKALIVAHRKELLDQAQAKVQDEAPELKVEIEQGENHATSECDVVVASVQTVGNSKSIRLGKWRPEDFCVVVIDEAHHAPADTYRNVLRWLGCLKKGKKFIQLDDTEMEVLHKHGIELVDEDSSNDDWNKDILLLGVTATPNRMDNKGVNTIFDKQTFSFDIKAGVDAKALVRPRGKIIRTGTDITKVKQQQGDFQVGELSQAIDTPERNLLIVKAYLDNRNDMPYERAIVFAADVKHTKNITQAFLDQGIAADYVTGETPKEERKQKLKDFETGKLSVMVNAMVLTEGYDNEFIGGVLIARPTRSGILYLQMIGRGTRPVLVNGEPSPTKPHVLILDFVDVTTRHDVKTISHIINVEQPIDFQGGDVFGMQEKIENLLELAPGTDLSKLDISRIDYAIQEVDLLAGLQPPQEVRENTRFDWYKVMDGLYKINLGGGVGTPLTRSMQIMENQLGEWTVVERVWNKDTKKETASVIASYDNFKEALRETDRAIRTVYRDSIRLIDSTAAWRFGDVTPAQLEHLRRARVPEQTINRMKKGDAVRLLNKLWSQRR